MQIQLISPNNEPHPYTEILSKSLQELGCSVPSTPSMPTMPNVIIFLGDDMQGFSSAQIQYIETQITERFLGAELFLQARAFAFARIRCGINQHGQWIIAAPVDESNVYRITRLVEQCKRLHPESYESKMGLLSSAEQGIAEGIKEQQEAKEQESILVMQAQQTRNPNASPQNSPQNTPPVTTSTTPSTPNSIPNSMPTMDTTHLENSTGVFWQDRLTAWGLEIGDVGYNLAPEFEHDAIKHVLLHNSEKRYIIEADKQAKNFCIIAFPSVLRAKSRAFLLSIDGGLIALHRRQPTAILSPMITDLLFPDGRIQPEWHSEYPHKKHLSAVEGGKIYLADGKMLYSWDRRTEKLEGSLISSVASLLLQWSSR